MTKDEALGWLHEGPDAAGECDMCHREQHLWELPQQLQYGDGEWMYCATCFKRIIEHSSITLRG